MNKNLSLPIHGMISTFVKFKTITGAGLVLPVEREDSK